jgi:hypothetical protein
MSSGKIGRLGRTLPPGALSAGCDGWAATGGGGVPLAVFVWAARVPAARESAIIPKKVRITPILLLLSLFSQDFFEKAFI